jgi:hypothetical protein
MCSWRGWTDRNGRIRSVTFEARRIEDGVSALGVVLFCPNRLQADGGHAAGVGGLGVDALCA